LTLDAGALIAAERGDRRFWVFWKEALRRDVDVTVPAAALAQAWRGGKNARTAMVLAACAVDELDERAAKQAGILCGRSGTADIVDASVMAGAARRRDDVLTSDPADLERLSILAPGARKVLDLRRLSPASKKAGR
jgi:hypothetical protein